MASGGLKCEVLMKVVVRGMHLTSTMIMLTLLILECFCDLNKNTKLQENPDFKKLVNYCGIAMISSGIWLVMHMKKEDAMP